MPTPQLVDHLGRPVSSSGLTQEQAAPRLGSVRSVWREPVASGLTPERLAGILRQAEGPYGTPQYLALAEEMEERELHYASVLHTRKLAVLGLDLQVEAFSDSTEHVAQKDFIVGVTKRRGFRRALYDCLDAIAKGYAFVEMLWETGERWRPSAYVWRDPRWFAWDLDTGQTPLLLTDLQPLGVPLQPFHFLSHRPLSKSGLPIRGGLARLAAVAYMCKSYTLKDWLAFAEVFGLPIRVGKHPPAATQEQIDKLITAVTNLGTDAGAVIPDGMVIDFVQAPNVTGGQILFKNLAEYLDGQISKAVLGQTMTSDDGSSRSQAEVHKEVRQDLLVSDAVQLSETIQRDFVEPLIDLNFGKPKDEQYPQFKLTLEDETDLKVLSEALPVFIDRGLRIEASVIRDKFGLPEPKEGTPEEDILQPMVKAPAPGEPGAEDDDSDEAKGKALQRALHAAGGDDLVAELALLGLDDWKPLAAPVVDPLLALARSAQSYDDFRNGLEMAAAEMDSSPILQSLAALMLHGRAVGKATELRSLNREQLELLRAKVAAELEGRGNGAH